MDAESSTKRNLGALRHMGGTAALLSLLSTASRILDQWSATGSISLNSQIIYSALFWFVGGAVIGYLTWRRSHRAEARRDSEV